MGDKSVRRQQITHCGPQNVLNISPGGVCCADKYFGLFIDLPGGKIFEIIIDHNCN